MNAITLVPFHGHNLVTLYDGKTVRVVMKPISDDIGLQWEAQYKRIKRHAVLSTCMSMMDIQLFGDTQKRQHVTLPLDMLNGWLFGVDTNRVKPEIRDKLITYQRECFQVLSSYWMGGVAVNPRRQDGVYMSDMDAYRVFFLTIHFDALYDIFKKYDMYEAFGKLGSRAGIEMIDHFKDGRSASYQLRRDFDPQFDAIQRRHHLNQYSLR